MRLSEQQRSIKSVQNGVLAGSLALSTKVVNLWIWIVPRAGIQQAPTGWSAGGGCRGGVARGYCSPLAFSASHRAVVVGMAV